MFEFILNYVPDFGYLINGVISFALIVFASWCVGEGGEILGERFDASIIGGLLIAWLNTSTSPMSGLWMCCNVTTAMYLSVS
jgi:hypothetical protein